MSSKTDKNNKKPDILIIDDEREILESLRRRFELESISVETCQSPTVALDLMFENNYNLIITDIKMPEMDGIVLLKRIKSRNPLCNIIIMTGYSNMDFVVESLSSGASDYFIKPFNDLDKLVEVVKQAIDRVERWKKNMGFGKERREQLCKTG